MEAVPTLSPALDSLGYEPVPFLVKNEANEFAEASVARESTPTIAPANLTNVQVDVGGWIGWGNNGCAAGATGSGASTDGAPASMSQCVELPMSLPAPTLHASTNPYINLAAHLRHYGLDVEAQEFARSQVPCDFVLNTYLTMHSTAAMPSSAQDVSRAGEMLMRELEQSLRARLGAVQEQLHAAVASVQLPPSKVPLLPGVCLPWMQGPAEGSIPQLPTHLLAVCAGGACGSAPGQLLVVDAPCLFVPIHWIVYALQCAHLPTGVAATAPSFPGGSHVPIVALPVPYPEYWSLVHRWMYTRDAAKLLAALLPLESLQKHVYGTHTKPMPPSAAIDALACLSLATLLRAALRIRATWHNGRHIGVYADNFWAAVSRAWTLVVTAMVLRKARMSCKAEGVQPADKS